MQRLQRWRQRPHRLGAASRGRERGQALLELAIVTPILVLLIMAIFQFGYVLESQMGLTNAVREAARRAAATTETAPVWSALEAWIQGELCGDAASPCDDQQALLPANIPGFNPGALTTDPPTVTFCRYDVAGASGTVTNYQVNVAVTYQHPLFFGLLAFATDALDGTPNSRWDLSSSAQMRLEFVDDQDPLFAAPPDGMCP